MSTTTWNHHFHFDPEPVWEREEEELDRIFSEWEAKDDHRENIRLGFEDAA